jgi:hypothetical protein
MAVETGRDIYLQDTHAHGEDDAELFCSVHHQRPENEPWQKGQRNVHRSRVSY